MTDDSAADPVKTYAPSFHNETETNDGKDMAENIERFTDELPDIEFEVEFDDGSSFIIDEWDAHALLLKHDIEHIEGVLAEFRSEVKHHFENRTEPTRMGTGRWGQSSHDSSQEEYDVQAELAPIVLYPHIRAPLMQLAFIAMSDEDEDPVNVIGIGEGEITQYGEFGRIVIESREGDE